jgi:hypothetical protein
MSGVCSKPDKAGRFTIYAQCIISPFSTAKRETGAGLTSSEHLSRAEAKGPDQYGHPTFHPAKDLPSPTCIHERERPKSTAMEQERKKPPFWRRNTPKPEYDISVLRPANMPTGQRFETLADARKESERSEKLLLSFSGGNKVIGEYLQECRDGYYECNKPFCPICARQFRRWFVGELLRVTEGRNDVHIYTILLKEAATDKINELDPTSFRASLRKRLQRSGLAKIPVIGGFEIVYKAAKRVWVLHANLVVIGGNKSAHKKFKEMFHADEIDRALVRAALKDRAEQLSYVLKFTTYHRPYEQQGPTRPPAKPLNTREHAALLKWMSQFEFADFMLLINARRQGGKKIVFSSPGAAKN